MSNVLLNEYFLWTLSTASSLLPGKNRQPIRSCRSFSTHPYSVLYVPFVQSSIYVLYASVLLLPFDLWRRLCLRTVDDWNVQITKVREHRGFQYRTSVSDWPAQLCPPQPDQRVLIARDRNHNATSMMVQTVTIHLGYCKIKSRGPK